MNENLIDVVGLLRSEVEGLMRELGEPEYRGRQLFHWVQARRARDLDAMTSLPRELRAVLAGRVRVSRPEVSRVQCSLDGTRKYLLRLEDGQEIESVLIPMTGG